MPQPTLGTAGTGATRTAADWETVKGGRSTWSTWSAVCSLMYPGSAGGEAFAEEAKELNAHASVGAVDDPDRNWRDPPLLSAMLCL